MRELLANRVDPSHGRWRRERRRATIATAAALAIALLRPAISSAAVHASAAIAGAPVGQTPAPGRANDAPADSVTLFRVVLTDGTAVSSYGEWARVGDRIVFTMPIGDLRATPRLQLVSLPLSAVNWETTQRYADAVRYAHYLTTAAEADFAAFTGEIAELLREIDLAPDLARRLSLAERARRLIAAWPREHYGYRSRELGDIAALVDETISVLRAQSGVASFDLALVAMVEPPVMPALSDPTRAQTIDQAMRVARLVDTPAERQAVLTSVVAAIDEAGGAGATGWLGAAREGAISSLEEERAYDRAYDRLARESLSEAGRLAARADVLGVARVASRVQASDRRMGARRREAVTALLGAIDQQLDSARRLRLVRDRWSTHVRFYYDYERAVRRVISRLDGLRPQLDAVRAQAGPPPSQLGPLSRWARALARDLTNVPVPSDLEAVHAELRSAAELAARAFEERAAAVDGADSQVAANAAAASGGALMMFTRARSALAAMLLPPTLR